MGQLVDQDQEHLRLLMWANYLWAGTIGFFSLFTLFYIGLGAMMTFGGFPLSGRTGDDPRIPGLFFMGFGAAFLVLGVTFAILTFLAARSIRDRRRRVFCLIMAGLNCLQVPFGTAMGVCTIMVLNRPDVKAMFERPGPPIVPADT